MDTLRSVVPSAASSWDDAHVSSPVTEGDQELRSVEERVSLYYVELSDRVFRYLAYGCRDVSDAEELRQETFLRLYRALKRQERIDHVQSWVFKVARNLILDRAKHLRRISSKTCEMPDHLPERVPDPTPTPEERLLEAARRGDRREQLKLASQELTDLQRECIYLRAQGLELRQIGDILNMDMRRVSEVLQRAVATLKRRVNARAPLDNR